MNKEVFTNERTVFGCKGGAVSTAEKNGKFYVITNECAMVDMMPEEFPDWDGLACVAFYSEAEREHYLRERGWILDSPAFPYENPSSFCHGVLEELQRSTHHPTRLVARPWNRFDSNDNEWWIIPSTIWPAYKFAKFFFRWEDNTQTTLFAGFYVEKGLGAIPCKVFGTEKYHLQPDWAWHRFLRELSSPLLQRVIAGDFSRNPTMRMEIAAGTLIQPDRNRDRTVEDLPKEPQGEMVFQWNRFDDRMDPIHINNKDHHLDPLLAARSIDEMARGLKELEADEWQWVNVCIGLLFQTSRVDEPELQTSRSQPNAWTQLEITQRLFQPMLFLLE